MTCRCGYRIEAMACIPKISPNFETSFIHLEPFRASLSPCKSLSQSEVLLAVACEGKDDVWLCFDCLERVANAIEVDTERLKIEFEEYQRMMKSVQSKTQSLQMMYSESAGISERLPIESIDAAFDQEITDLHEQISQFEEELSNLQNQEKELDMLSMELDAAEGRIMEVENDLEIEARAMSCNQFELTKSLEMFQLELEKLCLIDISLYTLEVDETGRRYPKINGFRLAFCPKGDLEWDEIQIAWGQLAQLILSMTIVPRDWCIIPLTTCAKIIYQKEVFNLGKDISSLAQALKVLVRMLESSGRLVPYAISENMIGDINIAKLSVNKESPNWSTLIHYLVSNLRHLSKCIAEERRDTMCQLLIAV